ncbi:hypothetical protein HN011_000374 [Eciton burchellii]|nr:hypothetical protein HN011_000374 [Eciton burchellii]
MISELSSECHDPVGYGFFQESLLSRQVLQVKTDPNDRARMSTRGALMTETGSLHDTASLSEAESRSGEPCERGLAQDIISPADLLVRRIDETAQEKMELVKVYFRSFNDSNECLEKHKKSRNTKELRGLGVIEDPVSPQQYMRK